MRYYVFLFLLLTTSGFSQISNFQVESDGNISYKKIFEMNEFEKNDLIDYLNSLSNFSIISSENEILGQIKDLRINFKKYGKGGYPVFLRNSLSSDVIIQFKDNRYRLILKNIGFLDDVSYGVTVSSVTVIDTDNFTSLSEYYVKKDGTLRDSKIVERTLDVMDKHFSDLFTIKKIDEDWWLTPYWLMVLLELEPGFYLKNLDFPDGSNFELDWFDNRTNKT